MRSTATPLPSTAPLAVVPLPPGGTLFSAKARGASSALHGAGFQSTCAKGARLRPGPACLQAPTQGFKLQGTYKIDKTQSVALQYMFQHLSSNDYYYNGYQLGYTPTSVMPSQQQSPNYNVNVIMLMYRAQL